MPEWYLRASSPAPCGPDSMYFLSSSHWVDLSGVGVRHDPLVVGRGGVILGFPGYELVLGGAWVGYPV